MLLQMMKVKCPYTKLERVVQPSLEIAAGLIHDGTKVVDKIIKQIPLSNSTIGGLCITIFTDLKQQLIQKLLKAPSFGIQLNESSDVRSQSQLMVFT